ncbi:MAG: phage tail tape measure protein [Pseudomonadota bacterium]
MADAQRTIDLIFNGVDRTGAATQAALRNTRSFSDNLERSTQPFANASAAALKYEAALLATGAAVTAFSIKAAGDFDEGFREIASLLDEPIEALGGFREEILAYGRNSSASLADVNAAVYAAISAGVDYTNSLQAVSVAERLSIAGKGDLNDTLTLLVSSLNAYGKGTEEAAAFSDALFTTVRLGQTTLPELNSSLQAVTGTAATLGVPFEEVLAALAALTAAGTPTAQAVTQINAVLAALLKPSSQAANEAKRLGIEFSAQAVQANGLQATLQTVFEATDGNEAVMAKLFPRVEALRAVFPLTGIAADRFASNLTELQESAGATEVAYGKLADSLSNTTGRLSSSFEALAVTIGAPLLDEFNSVADALGQVFNVLSSQVTGSQLSEITAFIESEFDSLSSVLQGIAQSLPRALSQADLSGFVDGLAAVRGSIAGLFGGLDLTQADDLARALTFVGNAFEGLSQFSAGVIQRFGPLLQYFAELSEQALASGEALNAVGSAFGAASIINIFAGSLGGVSASLTTLLALMIGNQGLGLIGSLRELKNLLSGGGIIELLTRLRNALGVGAAVGVAGAGGFALGTAINELVGRATGRDLAEWASEAAGELTGLNRTLDELGRELTATTAPSAQGAAQSIADLDREMLRLSESGDGVFNFTTGLSESIDETVATLQSYPEALREAADAQDRLGADGEKLTGFFSVVSSGADTARKSIDALAGASDELRGQAIVAAIEGATQINVARIEADTDRVVAAFGSINSTVQSTGDSLTSLYGLLGDENVSRFDQLDIQEGIRREEDRRDSILKKQERALEAEIRKTQAQAEAFRRGDALIRVDGAGLQPHLEAIMWEILSAIRVRVNQDGNELLLGISS